MNASVSTEAVVTEMKMFYEVKDIQQFLRISRSSTYELIGRADFPKLRIGSAIRIPVSQFHEWVDKQLM